MNLNHCIRDQRIALMIGYGFLCPVNVFQSVMDCWTTSTIIDSLFSTIHQQCNVSDVGLFAQTLHTLYVALHGVRVGDLCGTAIRKPAPHSISHSLPIAPS